MALIVLSRPSMHVFCSTVVTLFSQLAQVSLPNTSYILHLYVTFNPRVALGSSFVAILGEWSVPNRFILFCLGRHGQPGHDERVSCGNGIFRICIWLCVAFVGLHY